MKPFCRWSLLVATPSTISSRVVPVLVVLLPAMMVSLVVLWAIMAQRDRAERVRMQTVLAEAVEAAAREHLAKDKVVAEARHSREVEAHALSRLEEQRKTAEEQSRRADRAQEELARLRAGDPEGASAADLRKRLQDAEAQIAAFQRLAREQEDQAEIASRKAEAERNKSETELRKAEAERNAFELNLRKNDNPRLPEGRKPPEAIVKDPAPAWQAHPTAVHSVAISPDGRHLVTTSGSVTRLWDAGNGAMLREWVRKDDAYRQAAFTSDGTGLAILAGDGIHLVEVDTGAEIRKLQWKGSNEGTLAIRPVKGQLLFGGGDSSLKLFDLATGALLMDLHETDAVRAVAFSADGRMVAYGKENGDVAVKEMDVPGTEWVFKAQTGGGVSALAFSPDGKRLATVGANGLVQIWNTTDHLAALTLRGHNGPVTSLTFSRDGSLLAAGGGTQAHAWDAASGREVLSLASRADHVGGVAFDVTGKRLFVGEGTAVRVCAIEPARR